MCWVVNQLVGVKSCCCLLLLKLCNCVYPCRMSWAGWQDRCSAAVGACAAFAAAWVATQESACNVCISQVALLSNQLTSQPANEEVEKPAKDQDLGGLVVAFLEDLMIVV